MWVLLLDMLNPPQRQSLIYQPVIKTAVDGGQKPEVRPQLLHRRVDPDEVVLAGRQRRAGFL